MMELIRNCSHESLSATYLVTGSAGKKLIKASDAPLGIISLKRELQGWGWYSRLRYPQRDTPVCSVLQQNAEYLRIEIEFINGKKNDFRKGLIGNAGLLKRVMFHYCDIWPSSVNGYSVLHGDLSVDNIIYNAQGIHIIDWEYFNPEGAPWGFDAAYLLFETLYFGMRRRKYPSQREIDIIADNLNILNSRGQLAPEFMMCPLKTVKSFIASSFKNWGEDLLMAPGKLPVVLFTDEQVSLIDQAVAGRAKR